MIYFVFNSDYYYEICLFSSCYELRILFILNSFFRTWESNSVYTLTYLFIEYLNVL
jgi:hypothetical protein